MKSSFEIEMELRERFPVVSLSTVVADIKDLNRLDAVFQESNLR